MVGILVHGNNHFILSGPRPDEPAALALARHWSLIEIGGAKSQSLEQWQIRTKEFRENLEWAVIVPADREPSPGVAELLAELSARGIAIDRCCRGCW
jgi:beta-phosphoglucomutase-like phosphatase (HAD superfamily)